MTTDDDARPPLAELIPDRASLDSALRRVSAEATLLRRLIRLADRRDREALKLASCPSPVSSRAIVPFPHDEPPAAGGTPTHHT